MMETAVIVCAVIGAMVCMLFIGAAILIMIDSDGVNRDEHEDVEVRNG